MLANIKAWIKLSKNWTKQSMTLS